MTNDEMTERKESLVEKIERDIAGPYRCSLLSVFPNDDADSDFVSFTYTIGLVEMGWPELILAGVGGIVAQQIINDLVTYYLGEADTLEDGEVLPSEPEAGDLVPRIIQKYNVRLQTISDDQRDEYLCWAVKRQDAMGGPELDVLQIVYPDEQGRWPEDPECDPKTAFIQQLPTEKERERV